MARAWIGLVGAMALAGCMAQGGGSGDEPFEGGGGGAPRNTVIVTIADGTFRPATVTVPRGSAVAFIDQDEGTHTVSALDGSWSSGLMRKGDAYTVNFDRPGAYAFDDQIHPQVTGTVMVQ